MKEIGVVELKKLFDENANVQLIDVREEWEHQMCNIGGTNIPMGKTSEIANSIDKSKQVIIYCRSGRRSADIIHYLESEHGFEGLYNLVGGILDWSAKIDPSIRTY